MVPSAHLGETCRTGRIPCVAAVWEDVEVMSKFKRVARLAAGALLATGIFAGSVAPASAAPADTQSARMHLMDTGWGG